MTPDERRRKAAHEAGHALAAHILGYQVLWVELAGPCGAVTGWQRRDARPEWRLNGRSAPPPDLMGWHDGSDEVVITFCGEAAEELADGLPELSADAGALAAAQAVIEDVPIGADAPGAPWQVVPLSDAELAERLLAGITSSEHEAAALRVALRCRALAIVRTEQFKAAHEHLAVVLLQSGWLGGEALRVELERAEVRASQVSEGGGHAEAA